MLVFRTSLLSATFLSRVTGRHGTNGEAMLNVPPLGTEHNNIEMCLLFNSCQKPSYKAHKCRHFTIFYNEFALPRRLQTSDECLEHFEALSKTRLAELCQCAMKQNITETKNINQTCIRFSSSKYKYKYLRVQVQVQLVGV